MAAMTYLDLFRKLYHYTGQSLADAGLAATNALDAEGYPLNYQAADEVAFRLTSATAIIGVDWDAADPAGRRMLLHIAELPSGTLRFLEERARDQSPTPSETSPPPGG